MPFEQVKPFGEIQKERKERVFDTGTEKLLKFLELMARELRRDGVPVDNECRVDMNAFEKIYSKEVLNQDRQKLKRLEAKWRDERSLSKSSIGEKMEMLKTIIFYKNLSPDFIVVRTSRYDDVKNGVDNIILEKKTGNLVCAFDEVASKGTLSVTEKGRQIYKEKRNLILEKNTEGGGHLKYGLKMAEDDGMKLRLGEVKNVPIFYLALLPVTIKQGIKNLKPLPGEQSNFEKDLFYSFIKSLRCQINFLVLTPPKPISPELKTSLLLFKKSLERFSQNK